MAKQTTAKKAATKSATSSTSTGQKKTAAKTSTTAGSNGMQNTMQKKEPLLEKLFKDMLKDTLWAERHLVSALTTMQNVATTQELQDAFEDHIFATQKHEARLKKVFAMLGEEPEAKKCDAMEGLTKEATTMIQETQPGTMTRDAALIIAAQKVEHYEIATYGSLVQIARTIDREDVARILEKTLWEEEDTDLLLTDIAEANVNPMADEEGDEQEEGTAVTGLASTLTNV
jgi:ferritin-like metal-binding protein YciE